MEIARDIRDAGRRLVTSPGLTLGAVLAVSVGLGGAVAVFRVIDAALFAPMELRKSDGVMVLSERRLSGDSFNVISPDEFRQLTSPDAPLQAIAAMTVEEETITSPTGAAAVRVARVSPAFFQVFDVPPLAGRNLRDDDTSGQFGDVAVVSETFWNRHFRDDNLSDHHMSLDGRPVTIVGIIPSTFTFPQGADVWRPVPSRYFGSSRLHYLSVVMRRHGSTSDDAVRAYIDVVNARLAAASQAGDAHAFHVTSFAEATLGTTRPTLILLAAAIAILLILTACSVANLLFARTWARRGEYSLRAALGATRACLMRGPLWDSAMLALPAGVLAVAFANAGVRALHAVTENRLPALNGAVLDGPATVFLVILVSFVAFGIGIVPAIAVVTRVSRPRASLQMSQASRQHLPHALVAIQVCLAVVLATGAGLFAKSFYLAMRVNTGMAADEIVTWRVALPSTRYGAVAIQEFYRSASERLGSLSQVRGVSATLALPFTSSGGYRVVKPQGADDARSLRVSANVVGPDYFTTMGIPLLSGREFGDSDLAGGSAVTAIGASLARAVFGTANAVGRVIVFDDSFGRTEATVIGVVDDTKTTRLAPETELQAYTPGLRSPRMALVVRLRHEPQTADLQALQTTARAIDPDIPIEFTPLTDLLFNEISLPALRTGLLMTFAIQAVLIGAIGVLGLVRWRVAQRAPELALRIALGATPRVLCIFLLRTEMAWVFAGIVAGTLVTLVVTPMAASMLTFVSPIDATVLPGTIALLVTVALTAVIPIARRVTLDAHGLLAAFRDPTRS